MDRRQKKTREAIMRSFTELLKTENYGRITVQQIIDRADIGRTTFYAHFETKDELLRSLCGEIFEHVFSEALYKEKTHDFSKARGVRERITHILYHLQEHMEYLPGMLTGEIFLGDFEAHLKTLFERAIPEENGSVPREYRLRMMVRIFAETVRWWSRNSGYTPEEVAGFFFEITPVPGEGGWGAFSNSLPEESK